MIIKKKDLKLEGDKYVITLKLKFDLAEYETLKEIRIEPEYEKTVK